MMMKTMMKKVLIVGAAIAAMMTATVSVQANGYSTAYTQSTQTVYAENATMWVLAEEGVNVRCGGGTDFARIGGLYKGDAVNVIGRVYVNGAATNWVQISFNGGIGYVMDGGLSYSQVSKNAASSSNISTGSTQQISSNTSQQTQQTATAGSTVVYPRVDKHLVGADGTDTWCSLNTDGNYYNHLGQKFIPMGGNLFMNTNGQTLQEV